MQSRIAVLRYPSTDRVRPIDAPQIRHPCPSVTVSDGLAVARPRQALLDRLRVLEWDKAKDLGARAVQRRIPGLDHQFREIERLPGSHGNRQLRRLARRFSSGSKEESERRMNALLRRAGIYGYRQNVRGTLPGYGEEARLVAEV